MLLYNLFHGPKHLRLLRNTPHPVAARHRRLSQHRLISPLHRKPSAVPAPRIAQAMWPLQWDADSDGDEDEAAVLRAIEGDVAADAAPLITRYNPHCAEAPVVVDSAAAEGPAASSAGLPIAPPVANGQ